MTAVVRAEHARRTWLTGTTGLLIVAIAFAMMAWAAPSPRHASAHAPGKSTSITVQLDAQVWTGTAPASGSLGVRTPSAVRP
jgi:hypothetical protein